MAEAEQHWIACRFAGRHFDAGRDEVEHVATDRGDLSELQMVMLRIWAGLGNRWELPDAPERAAAPPPSPWTPVLFLLQQVINAVTVACVYGLLAIGYTLVYGILGQINLAMGELTMIGAMTTAVASAGLVMLGAQGAAPALLAVLLAVMGFTAVQGWTMDRLVFRPFRGMRTHTPLIAAVGLAIAYQEAVRLLHGARDWWPPPVFATRHDLASAGGFTLTALTSQAIVLALTAGLYALLAWVMKRTAFGRAHRACADDVGAAALMGLDVNRTVATTFAIGGAYAAAAGYVIALYYGGINFFTGYLVGFKALAAAVVGGIGSVPGAMLGGALLGMVETFWSAYFAIEYKDIVAFGLLALFLVLRPQGLMGQERRRGD
ncbi:branched-chain amino acid ABC transporter permease [Azospirillum sp. TSO22-1]|uniref:branched-chain amino acid ABC transporter permease n=1 Tax=Azospirillum sp. TSO22-1 TaxID=716789 RepID=UPI001FFFCAF0|nr:branched-chain amino acid ABC transporter permease [Azospirillum sp. TSO22-1]